MKMMRTRAAQATMLLAAALGTAPAFAELSLPMEFYSDSRPINRLDSRVLPGASPRALPDGSYEVRPTSTLYLAPHEADVRATARQIYPTANCGVVDNELANEQTISDLVRWNIDQITQMKPYISELNGEVVSAGQACLAAIRAGAADRREKCDLASEIRRQVREIGEAVQPWEETIADLADSNQKRLEQLGKEPGGFVAATVKLTSARELQALRSANPGYSVATVPARTVVFSFVPAEDDINASLPKRTTVGFALAGQPLSQARPEGTPEAVTQITSGQAVALGVTLSRLGACGENLVRKGAFYYTFPSFGYVKGSVSFNKWKTYKKIEETKSRGGLFTTKTAHKLHEEMKEGQDFVFNVETDDESGTDYEAMKERMRAMLLQELLTSWAEVNTLGSGEGSLAMPNPRANGADVAGDAALKCPHVYCQAAGYALKTFSAIWGRQVSNSEVERAWNVTLTERWGFTRVNNLSDSSVADIQWQL